MNYRNQKFILYLQKKMSQTETENAHDNINIRALMEAGVNSDTFFLQRKQQQSFTIQIANINDNNDSSLPAKRPRGRPRKPDELKTSLYHTIPKTSKQLLVAIFEHPQYNTMLPELRASLKEKSQYYQNRTNRYTTTDYAQYHRWLRRVWKHLYRTPSLNRRNTNTQQQQRLV